MKFICYESLFSGICFQKPSLIFHYDSVYLLWCSKKTKRVFGEDANHGQKSNEYRAAGSLQYKVFFSFFFVLKQRSKIQGLFSSFPPIVVIIFACKIASISGDLPRPLGSFPHAFAFCFVKIIGRK